MAEKIVTGKVEKRFIVEHLIRTTNNQDDFWKHPTIEDVHEVAEEQMIDLKIQGEWEIEKVSGNRMNMRYHLQYSKEINNAFTKLTE